MTDILCQTVREAFTGERPPATEIVPDYGSVHLENEQIRDAFAMKSWDELPIPFLTYHRQAVFFFTPLAWAYFLPAYIQAILTHYDETDTMVNELLATLVPSRDAELEARRRGRIAMLSQRQRTALGKFVNWVASEHPDDLEDDDQQAILASLR